MHGGVRILTAFYFPVLYSCLDCPLYVPTMMVVFPHITILGIPFASPINEMIVTVAKAWDESAVEIIQINRLGVCHIHILTTAVDTIAVIFIQKFVIFDSKTVMTYIFIS